jgi:CRP-like cAMP-binding protein
VARDTLVGLTEVVPRSIASAGVGERRGGGGRRSDRPLGREGIDLLAQVPLFSGLSRRHLKKLAEHADLVSYRPRETIVKSGQPGGTFYVILEGAAKATRGSKTLGRLEPGDFFGEISLLDGGPRTATVTAETPVKTIRVFKRSFDKVVAEEPTVAAKILGVVARRLRDAERSISS